MRDHDGHGRGDADAASRKAEHGSGGLGEACRCHDSDILGTLDVAGDERVRVAVEREHGDGDRDARRGSGTRGGDDAQAPAREDRRAAIRIGGGVLECRVALVVVGYRDRFVLVDRVVVRADGLRARVGGDLDGAARSLERGSVLRIRHHVGVGDADDDTGRDGCKGRAGDGHGDEVDGEDALGMNGDVPCGDDGVLADVCAHGILGVKGRHRTRGAGLRASALVEERARAPEVIVARAIRCSALAELVFRRIAIVGGRLRGEVAAHVAGLVVKAALAVVGAICIFDGGSDLGVLCVGPVTGEIVVERARAVASADPLPRRGLGPYVCGDGCAVVSHELLGIEERIGIGAVLALLLPTERVGAVLRELAADDGDEHGHTDAYLTAGGSSEIGADVAVGERLHFYVARCGDGGIVAHVGLDRVVRDAHEDRCPDAGDAGDGARRDDAEHRIVVLGEDGEVRAGESRAVADERTHDDLRDDDADGAGDRCRAGAGEPDRVDVDVLDGVGRDRDGPFGRDGRTLGDARLDVRLEVGDGHRAGDGGGAGDGEVADRIHELAVVGGADVDVPARVDRTAGEP